MIKLLTFIVASTLTFTSWYISAEPVDSGPPAQIQKDHVPDSTANGNYLEPQPDENGATKNSTVTNKKIKKYKAKVSKPTNLEKSKKVTEDPQAGGMELK
jgi:hypothetical protein